MQQLLRHQLRCHQLSLHPRGVRPVGAALQPLLLLGRLPLLVLVLVQGLLLWVLVVQEAVPRTHCVSGPRCGASGELATSWPQK